MAKSKHVRHTQPRNHEVSPVQQAVPRGGLLDQLQLLQAGLLQPRQGQFLDLSGYDDYHAALDFVVQTKQRFQALPSALRRDCMNDPRQFLRLCSNAAQGDEVAVAQLKRHGLKVTPNDPSRVATTRPGEPVPRPNVEQQDLVQQSQEAPKAS